MASRHFPRRATLLQLHTPKETTITLTCSQIVSIFHLKDLTCCARTRPNPKRSHSSTLVGGISFTSTAVTMRKSSWRTIGIASRTCQRADCWYLMTPAFTRTFGCHDSLSLDGRDPPVLSATWWQTR